MDQTGDGHARRLTVAQVLGRLDKMVEAGRMSGDDAARLRAAADSHGLDEAVGEIRLKHAQAKVIAAVDNGRLTQEDANVILERLVKGEDPRFVLDLRLGSRQPDGRPRDTSSN